MLQIKKSNSIITAFILSVAMVVSILSKFSFVFPIQIVIFLLVFSLFIYLVNTNKFKIDLYITALIVFFITTCLSYINADFKLNVRDYIIILSSALMAGFSFSFLSVEWKKKIFIVPIFIALWLSMILFIRFLTNPQGFFYGDNFYETMALNINVIAGFFALIYPLFFIYVKNKQNKKAFIALTIFVLIAISLTKCRIAILLSYISTIIFLFEYRKNKIIKALIVLSIVLLVCSIVYVSSLKSSFNSIGDRFVWWKTAYLIFKENVIFGCGFGNYMVLFKTFRPELVVNTLFAHNIFMQLLAETGIVGVLGFSVLLVSFYMKFIKRMKEGENSFFYICIATSITSFIIINLVDYSFFVPANMLMFFIVFSSMFYIETEQRKNLKVNLYICLLIFVIAVFFLSKPIIANNYYKKGIDSYVSGYYKLSIEEFEKAINYDKKNPEYYAQISRAYFALYHNNRGEQGQIYADNSIRYLKQAIDLNKYSAQLKESLAAVYWNNDKKEEALKYIQEAVKYDKYNPYYEEEYYKIKNS